jgi:hypothetical protein
MGLITMLIRGLRMLLSAGGVFLALGMVTLVMMFGGGAVGLGGVFVMFGCFVVFVSGHCKPPVVVSSQPALQTTAFRIVLALLQCNS